MSAHAVDPLLVDIVGHQASLLGNEAIVRGALEAGVAFASGYPGTPSSEVLDSFARIHAQRGIVFEYSVNEKIALEMAFAASLAGARSICSMKHLGLMYAGDPISTIPYVGVVGGMVIVSAGDPSCLTSPNEQDQRHLGVMLHIPILDPSTPAEAHRLACQAFELSERSHLPVILRVTTRVCHSRATVTFGPLVDSKVEGFVRDPQRFTPIPMNAQRMRREIPGRIEAAREWMQEAGLFRRTGSGNTAVLATGVPAATCLDILREEGLEDEIVLAALGGVYPLPTPELCTLLGDVDTVLVVEELSPFVEDAVLALCQREGLKTTVLGKRSGHLPTEFEYEPAVIRRGLRSALELPVRVPDPNAATFEPVVPRPPSLCSACPHRSAFFAARAAFGPEHLYFNDIGCYTLGYGDPLRAVDALLCMGAGLTLAAGVSRATGQKTVGFVGDSTFFHSGMAPLLNAVKENVDMVAVILDNHVTGMTGFQESPTITLKEGDPVREVSIEGVARALGAERVETVKPNDLAATIAAFTRARDHKGLSVIVAEQTCPVFHDRVKGVPQDRVAYEIDHDLCQTCGRESAGHRCHQTVTRGLEQHMAYSRALEVAPQDGPKHGAPPAPVAPCATECPLHLCVQGYAGHIASGQYREAYELIASRCALPGTVCRVCHRPCETVCVRRQDGEAVAINDLKRFAVDWAAEQEQLHFEPPIEPKHGKRAAVVGSGPAGLTAAHDLAYRGYDVTVYDAATKPGGLLRTGIPAFRLPRDVLERDLEGIFAPGIEFRGGVALGRDVQLDGLLAAGHDVVLLALGAHGSTELGLAEVQGAGPTPAVVDALAYLAAALEGEEPPTGKRVAVVGGGNAAMDAARVARRLGAREVSIVYRRRQEEMPALPEEVREAELEGVELRTLLQPTRLIAGDQEGGGALGLECISTTPGEPDDSGRCRPLPVPGSEVVLEVDQVIVAIGQWPETDGLEVSGTPLERRRDGSLVVDEETGRTSHPQVFAAGDVLSGERTVTDAMAAALRAAWGIDVALRGKETADRRAPPGARAFPVPPSHEQGRRVTRRDRVPRQHSEELPIAERSGFAESARALSEAQARAEGDRCAVCGQCGNCRACLDLFGCPAFHMAEGKIEIDEMLCTGCGVCADFCPNGAIRPVAGSES